MGSATIQGQLWGARAEDWAAYVEQVCLPLHGAVLDAARVTSGTRLLDAGCGAGLLALLASLRGAQVSALDASPGLLAIARKRVPSADVREGDLEALPFDDASFDAVAAVNSVFYAADMAQVMRELARVVRPGGRVVVTAWGPLERCEFLRAVMPGLAPLMPPPPPGAHPPHPGHCLSLARLPPHWRRPDSTLSRRARSRAPSSFLMPRSRGAEMPAPASTKRPLRTAGRRQCAPSTPMPTEPTPVQMEAFVMRTSSSGQRGSDHK